MDTTTTTEATEVKDGLHQLVERISDVSTLPPMFARIVAVANDPAASAVDLKGVVEQDPPLATKLLKTVNSACFGLRTPTSNLQSAISLLGFNAVRNLALTVSVSELFQEESTAGGYSRRRLWEHMVSTALCARMIARRTAFAQFEDAYLGGLLHDIGMVMLDQHDHDRFGRAVAAVTPARRLCTCEQEILGFDHAELGALVLGGWRFPQLILECIRWHHSPHRSNEDARMTASAVALADFLCNQKGIDAFPVKHEPRLRSSLLNELELDQDDLRVLWEDMDEELASATDLLRL